MSDTVVPLTGNRKRTGLLDDRGVWTVERLINGKPQQFISLCLDDASELAEKAVEQATAESIGK